MKQAISLLSAELQGPLKVNILPLLKASDLGGLSCTCSVMCHFLAQAESIWLQAAREFLPASYPGLASSFPGSVAEKASTIPPRQLIQTCGMVRRMLAQGTAPEVVHLAGVTRVTADPKGRSLAGCHAEGTQTSVSIWSALSGQRLVTVLTADAIVGLEFLRCSCRLAMVDRVVDDNDMAVFTYTVCSILDPDQGRILRSQALPDLTMPATANMQARLYSGGGCVVVGTLPGKLLLVWGWTGEVIWQCDWGQPGFVLMDSASKLMFLSLKRDGNWHFACKSMCHQQHI